MKQDRVVPLVKGSTRYGPGPSRGGGWEKPLDAELDQLEADIAGLDARLGETSRPGKPAAYAGYRTFQPEKEAFPIDAAQDGVSSVLVNYVVHDGVTHEIPVWFPGPGVFVARMINVAIKRRLIVKVGTSAAEMSVPYAKNMYFGGMAGGVAPPPFTTKFSLPPVQPFPFGIGKQDLTVNYFWNMIDQRSGRRIADELMSSAVLTHRTPMVLLSGTPLDANPTLLMHDGKLYDLPVPWVFERDGQATFQFRPITPVLQYDSSIAGTVAAPLGPGLSYDDRVDGFRNQAVTVTVELHGYRYDTDQDAMKAGALTRGTG